MDGENRISIEDNGGERGREITYPVANVLESGLQATDNTHDACPDTDPIGLFPAPL